MRNINPTNINSIRILLGEMGYFKKSIQDYAQTSLPLYELIKKEWKRGEKACDKLKELSVNKDVSPMKCAKVLTRKLL